MKIAVGGKGGVGKTLIAGTLSRFFSRDEYRVLAVDADPAMNLAYALGIPADVASRIVPITENEELVRERAGEGPIFTLNPTVNDIADKYGVVGPDDVRLLVMGTIRSGGSGCMCPANSLVRALIRHLTLERDEVVIMDMEAGLEHLGRATVRGFDVMLCVVEPGAQSLETARKIVGLASDIRVKEVLAVGNKIITDEDRSFIEASLKEIGLEIVGVIPFDQKILRADARRMAPIDFSPTSSAIKAIKELEETFKLRYH
ncbi:MAG: AAA family ATPase [Nitrososphaeria archaeon]|nr:AAA family ATPase [Nitrososphaeria archaeon]NIN51588.1 AAA family ATPase [Nitrososphaeria archaeon]NIQ32073.1 AAA family ATPase [Nitrososphaeria archaeon]